MNKIKILFLFLAAGLMFSSCYKEEDWVGDNVDTEDKYYPIIQKAEASVSTLHSGETSVITVTYWSHDAIKNIELLATENGEDRVVTTWPYSDSFDKDAYAEVTNIDYVAPSFTDTTDVTITATVNNNNGLSKSKSITLTVYP